MSTRIRLGACVGGLSMMGLLIACGESSNVSDPSTGGALAGSAAAPPVAAAPPTTTPAVTTPGSAPPAANPTPTPGIGVTPPAANPTPAPGAIPPGTATPPPPSTGMMPVAGSAPAMDECGLKTNYAGDNYCINPPPADKGFQLHIGPTEYTSPDRKYILAAGQEVTNDFAATSTNDKEMYFYYRQYRMRPGAHHNIITSGGAGDSGLGQRIGTVNTLVEDYPKGGVIAPENKGVGIKMAPHTSINVSLHSINTTEKAQLRELWVNFWYRDAAEVSEPVKEVFSIAPMQGILPGQDVVVKGSCSVAGAGRMLWAYGHRHANNVRFSVWHQSGAKKDLVYQGYNWEEPITFDYSSTVMNPMPDAGGAEVEGGWSGPLEFKAGDSFPFECRIVNKTNGTLNFTNNTYTGEMCILDAETVGAGCN